MITLYTFEKCPFYSHTREDAERTKANMQAELSKELLKASEWQIYTVLDGQTDYRKNKDEN